MSTTPAAAARSSIDASRTLSGKARPARCLGWARRTLRVGRIRRNGHLRGDASLKGPRPEGYGEPMRAVVVALMMALVGATASGAPAARATRAQMLAAANTV